MALLYIGIILTLIAVIFPVGTYLIRNILRYGFQKIYFWLERMLKWSWLVGLIIFLIGISLIIIFIVV